MLLRSSSLVCRTAFRGFGSKFLSTVSPRHPRSTRTAPGCESQHRSLGLTPEGAEPEEEAPIAARMGKLSGKTLDKELVEMEKAHEEKITSDFLDYIEYQHAQIPEDLPSSHCPLLLDFFHKSWRHVPNVLGSVQGSGRNQNYFLRTIRGSDSATHPHRNWFAALDDASSAKIMLYRMGDMAFLDLVRDLAVTRPGSVQYIADRWDSSLALAIFKYLDKVPEAEEGLKKIELRYWGETEMVKFGKDKVEVKCVMHDKIMITNAVAFVGSYNMTFAAQTQHCESSLLSGSKDLKAQMTAHFDDVWQRSTPVAMEQVLNMKNKEREWLQQHFDFATLA